MWQIRAMNEFNRWPITLFGTITMSLEEHYALDARIMTGTKGKDGRFIRHPQNISELSDSEMFSARVGVFGAVIFISIIKLSVVITQSLTSRLNPTWIFVGSFALLIIIGAGLLFLPRATTHPIRFIDALFTSVSAVCVIVTGKQIGRAHV